MTLDFQELIIDKCIKFNIKVINPSDSLRILLKDTKDPELFLKATKLVHKLGKSGPFNGFSYHYCKYYAETDNTLVTDPHELNPNSFIFKSTLDHVKKEKDMIDIRKVETVMQQAAFIETVIASEDGTYDNKELFKVLTHSKSLTKFNLMMLAPSLVEPTSKLSYIFLQRPDAKAVYSDVFEYRTALSFRFLIDPNNFNVLISCIKTFYTSFFQDVLKLITDDKLENKIMLVRLLEFVL